MIEVLGSRKNLLAFLLALVAIPVFGYLSGLNQKNGIYIACLILGLCYILLFITFPTTAFNVLIFLGLMVWASSVQLIPGISLMIGVGGVFLVVWLVRLLSRNADFVAVNEFWYLSGLAIIVVISTVVNWGGPAGFVPVFSYVQLLILTISVVNFADNPAHLRNLGSMIIATSALTAALVILDKLGWQSISFVQYREGAVYYASSYEVFDRSGGIFGDPNMAAFQLLIALPFILEYWYGPYKYPKVLLLIAGICILMAFFYTVSMGGLMGLATILLMKTLFVRRQNILIKFLQVLLIGSILLWFSIYFLPSYYLDRVSSNGEQIAAFLQKPNEHRFLQLGSTRGDAWLATFKTFLRSPIIGNGPGNSTYISPLYSGLWHSGSQLAAHNFLLSVASDLGILGLILFVGVIISAIWAVRPFQRKQFIRKDLQPTGNAIFIALIACVVQGMALDIHVQKILWILLGMALTYKLLIRKNYENEDAGN